MSAAGVNGAFVAANDGTEVGSPGTSTLDAGSTTTTTSGTTTTTTSNGLSFQTWPGSASIQTASNYVFNGNLSGLDYEGSGGSVPGVLWGVRNGPGTLFRLLFDGTNWSARPRERLGQRQGACTTPDGTGDPDSEGVTFVGDSSAGGMYVSTERNNAVSNVSRISVLRFDPSAAGTSLNATNEWNLTADLPPQGANLGAEAITWIDDSYLVSQHFFDETKGHAYNPAEYANHGTGLFFVGIEGNGTIYVYALDQTGSGFIEDRDDRQRLPVGDGPAVRPRPEGPLGGVRQHVQRSHDGAAHRPVDREVRRRARVRAADRDAQHQQRGLRDRAGDVLRRRPASRSTGPTTARPTDTRSAAARCPVPRSPGRRPRWPSSRSRCSRPACSR